MGRTHEIAMHCARRCGATVGFLLSLAFLSATAQTPATRLVITGSTSGTAGVGDSLTISAVGLLGLPDPAYSGPKTLFFSGASPSPNPVDSATVTDNSGAALPFGRPTNISFSSGISSVSGTANGLMTLYGEGTDTIAVTDGTLGSNGADRLLVRVAPAPLARFAVGLTSPQTNGVPFTGSDTLTALDAFGNVVTTINASTDNVTVVSTLAGTISGLGSSGRNVLNQAADFVSGVANLSARLTYTGTAGTGTFSASAASGANGTSGSVTIQPGALKSFLVEAAAGGAIPSETAGTPFAIRVTARDTSGNTVTGFNGTVTLTSANGGLVGSPLTSGAFSAGVLASQNVTLTSAGTGRTITATNSTGTQNGASNAFVVNPGAPKQLVFLQQPTSTTSGTVITPAVTVQVEDSLGNAVPTAGLSVAMTLSGGTGTLTGTTTRTTDVSGIATFSDLEINLAGSKTLTASATNLTSAVSAAFTIAAGAASQLALHVQPSPLDTAGIPFRVQPVLWIEDAGGNLVTTDTSTLVTATRSTGSGILQGTVSLKAVNGVVTYTNLFHTVAGQITILFTSSPALTPVTSGTITVSPAAASKLAFVQQPTNTVAGATITPPVTVQVRDAFDNNVPQGGVSVTVSLSGGTGTLGGRKTVTTDAAGLATFSNLSINLTGAKQLTASSGTLASAVSTAFTITPGALSRLVFVQQPTTTTAGAVIAPPVTVQVQDTLGNPVPTAGISIVMALSSGTGVLSGTTTRATDTTGLATFNDLRINFTGSKSLTASSTGLTPATSTPFMVNPGGARKVAFVQQPTATTAGVVITPAVTVQVQDSLGNAVPASGVSIVMTLSSGTGVLGGTTTRTTDATGLATFNDLNINLSGSKTLTASSTGLTSATSSSFVVNSGAAKKVAFVQQPTNTAAGAVITPAVTIQIEDSLGNAVPTAGVSVVMTLSSGTGTLSGTTTKTTDATGLATFNDLSISQAGTKALTVSSTGLTPATSVLFTVSVGAAKKLAFVQQPANSTAGAVISPSVTVQVRDSLGNAVPTAGISVVMSLSGGTGTLSGTTTRTTDGTGLATFNDLSINLTGTKVLTASSAGLTSTTSTTFTVSPAAAKTLAYVQQPSNTAAGATITPPVTVQERDSFGNASGVAGDTVVIALSAGSGTLSGTTRRVTDASGTASFNDLSINLTGSKALTASRTGLTSAVSNAFTISPGSATRLVFLQQPTSVVAGAAITPAVTVQQQDALGNAVTVAGDTVTMSLSSGTGSLGGATKRMTDATGVATFNDLNVNLTGSKNLTASRTGLTSAVSAPFTVNPAPASKLVIATQPPATATAGVIFTPQPVIQIQDANGNIVTTDNSTVITATRNLGSGTLQGTTSVTAVNGVATFTNLSHTVATTITIQFTSSPSLTSATSNSIVVSAASSAKVVFVQQPTNTAAGSVITPSVTVQLQDAFSNNVLTQNVSVSVALSSGTGVLSGTTTRTTNSSGLATFSDLSINLTGAKTLTATSGSLTAALSGTFTINPVAASKVVFVQQPTNTAAGAVITPAVTVQLQDAFNNSVPTQNVSVSVALSGTGTLSGTKTRTTDATGLATFNDLSVNLTGAKSLTATSGSLTQATSASFTIGPAAAAKLAFIQQPANTVAGTAISPSVSVQEQDTFGNLVAVSGDTVTVFLSSGSGVLGGTTAQTTVSGVATFSNLSIDSAGTKRLAAIASGLISASSAGFTISPAAASKLAFGVSPGSSTAGVAFNPQPVVVLQDAFGNTVTGTVQAVTISVQDGAGTGAGLVGDTVLAVNTATGLAPFTGLSMTRAAKGYTLTATGSTVSTIRGLVVSAPFDINAAAAATVRVETLSDGTGTVLGTQSVSSGTSITVYSVTRDAYDNFVSNAPANLWAIQDTTGGVHSSDLVPSPDGRSATFTGSVVGSGRIRADISGLTSVPSGVLTVVVAGSPAAIRVETSPDGTGSVVPGQKVVSGKSLTVYAVARDAAGNFVGNVPADAWTLQVVGGGIVQGDLVASGDRKSAVFTAHIIGSGRILASYQSLAQVGSDTLVVVPGSPASVAAYAGTPQSAPVGATFPSKLEAVVRDASGNGVSAVLVTFSAPLAGASGVFAGGVNTATTNAAGIAEAAALTANTVSGSYVDSARVASVPTAALYQLTNLADVPAGIAAVAGTPQSTPVSTAFPTNLAARVKDRYGNAVPGRSVTFTIVPGQNGASGGFPGSIDSAMTDSGGVATAPALVANAAAGTFAVNATVFGVGSPAQFLLTNVAGNAAIVTAVSGTPQSTRVGALFSSRFTVLVKDGAGNPVSHVLVTFAAPPRGASGAFSSSRTDTVRTDSTGMASAATFTADTVAGSYTVQATVPGGSAPAAFELTNLPGTLAEFLIESASGGPIGTVVARAPFAIRVTGRDRYHNTATSFTGTVDITSSGTLVSGGGTSAPFAAGILASDSIAFFSAGRFTISATRTGGAETGRSDTINVNNPIPVISGLSPTGGMRGQSLGISIGGSGFIGGVTSVTFGDGITTSTSVTSFTQLTVQIRIDSTAALGPRDISVVNAPPGGGSFTLTGGFSVGTNPAPLLSAISVASGNRLQTLDVLFRGGNFLQGVTTADMGSGIIVNSTTVDSATRLTANITITSAAATGARDVSVVNAGSGGGRATLTGAFTVNNPVPLLSSISQSAGTRLSTLTIAMTGGNFISGVTAASFGDSGIVVTSTSVVSQSQLTAFIVVGSNAKTGLHRVTVVNQSPGGGTASLANAFTVVNPVPTLTGIQPGRGDWFQSLQVVLTGTNFIVGLTSADFGSGITVDSVVVDSSTRLRAAISISSLAGTGTRTITVSNPAPGGGASGPLSFVVATAVPPPPVLLSPADSSVFLPTTVTLRWRSSQGATRYRVQVARDSLFAVPVLKDSSVSDTSLRAGPLANDSTYFWRVAGVNSSGAGQFTVARWFRCMPTYPASLPISATVAYPSRSSPSQYTATDYRIVGIPGGGGVPLSQLVGGTPAEDWQAFWDNGAASNYLVSYDGSATFRFSVGRAFWLVKRGDWNFTSTVPSAPLDSVAVAHVPLHPGWNLITNPFTVGVPWTSVQAANGGVTDPIYMFGGAFSTSAVLEPYTGYYFFNSDSLDDLRIPYAGTAASRIRSVPDTGGWAMEVFLVWNSFREHSTVLGVSPRATPGMNALDHRKPRSVGDAPITYFDRPLWDARYRTFGSDIRPAFTDSSIWPFTVHTTGRTPMRLQFAGVSGVPSAFDVYLIDQDRACTVDLRRDTSYAFTPATSRSRFFLVIGRSDVIRGRLDEVRPKEFALSNNFPNPFNPSTTLAVSMPDGAVISLRIYNLLGQTVRTLFDGRLEAGRHWFTWDGRDASGTAAATGVYFARMVARGGAVFTRKMLLLR